jgi:hypothetical protein
MRFNRVVGWAGKIRQTWHLFQAIQRKSGIFSVGRWCQTTPIGSQIVECASILAYVVEQKTGKEALVGCYGKNNAEELDEVLKTYKLQGLRNEPNQYERDAAIVALNL